MMGYTIYPDCDIRGIENIEFGEDCVIQPHVWMEVQKDARLVIGKGVFVGRRSVIGCGGLVVIGDDALIGPSVYIADIDHSFKNVKIPIIDQGIEIRKPVKIGAGSWIGYHSAVMASVGKNSVIGANSTVTKDIPDFSLAVGSPAKVIKYYDFKKKVWVKNTFYRRLIKKICHFLKVIK